MKQTDIFKAIEQMKVLVIGDIMLDVYLNGDVERISQEAPVPIVRVKDKEERAGGAANVAMNCKSLGAEVAIAGVIGQDSYGKSLIRILAKNELDTSLIMSSKNRKTTTKTRIFSRNQQIIRFDSETENEMDTSDEHVFIEFILKYLQIHKPDVVIFEDYNKGLLKENVIKQIIRHCQILQITTAVDPKKNHFFAYEGVDLFKPNLKETIEGLNSPLCPVNLENLEFAHLKLHGFLNHQVSLITLSELGVFYQKGSKGKILPAHRRNIADVSGAGDTMIAVAALVYALTKDEDLMALWANLAGGLVCEEVGVVPVNKKRLINEIENKLL